LTITTNKVEVFSNLLHLGRVEHTGKYWHPCVTSFFSWQNSWTN